MNRQHGTIFLCLLMFLCSCQRAAVEKEMTDARIAVAIEKSLLVDDLVSAQLKVHVQEGVATLSGTVDNLLAKGQAERIAESMRGVRAVVNTIQVTSPPREDMDIKRDIERALHSNPATARYRIKVSVKGSIARLTGAVDSWNMRKFSERVVKGIAGLKGIENGIQVEQEKERSDREIKAHVSQRLRYDPYVIEDNIDVSVRNGTVVLSGKVAYPEEIHHIIEDAWVTGTQHIDASGLEVMDDAVGEGVRRGSRKPPRGDEEIRAALLDALQIDPRIISPAIEVDVSDGKVSLSGTVANLQEKRAAEQDAWNTTGVWSVLNDVTVQPKIPIEDNGIEAIVETLIESNVVLQHHDIEVSVRKSRVYLYGSVDNFFQRHLAEEIASNVNGVEEVQNQLECSDGGSKLPDEKIRENIEGELLWSLYVNSHNIKVQVEDHIATLEGTVYSWLEHRAAIENAFEGGAIMVVSKLRVKNQSPKIRRYRYRDFYNMRMGL